MKVLGLTALALAGLSSSSFAQTAETVVAPVAPVAAVAAVAAVPAASVLRAGTNVQLRTLTSLSTKGKKLKAGDRFDLETADAVTVNGQIAIPARSPAVGEITSIRNKGMWGKSGAIQARVVYVRVGERNIRLSGQLDDKGSTGTAGVIGAVVLLPVAGFFTTGTSAEIPAGSPVSGFVEEDVALPVGAAN